MVLLMTIEPGFGGQEFLDLVLPKIRRARQLIGRHGGDVWLQVDGGVSEETIERCAEAGADVFVAGSAVFGARPGAAGGQVSLAARRPRRGAAGRAVTGTGPETAERAASEGESAGGIDVKQNRT